MRSLGVPGQMCTFLAQILNIDGRAKKFYKKILFQTMYIYFIFQTRTLRLQCSKFGTKMYPSGTPTLRIILGAGHDHGPGPRRPNTLCGLFL